jgi:hypothetical protein
MKFCSLSFLICSMITLIGCSSNKIYNEPSDKYPFDEKMKTVLGENLDVIDSLRRAEVQVSYFDLKGYNNSQKILEITNLLEKDGWMLKGKGVGVNTYCLGLNNRINVVIVGNGELYDFKGGKLPKNNVDGVLYSYNKWGDDLCK